METNLHHSFWKRVDYNGERTARLIRNDHRTHFVLPVDIHNDLHANVEPVERPNSKVGRSILSRFNEQPKKYNNLDRIKDMSERLYDTEPDLSNMLYNQIPYLHLGIESLKRRSL